MVIILETNSLLRVKNGQEICWLNDEGKVKTGTVVVDDRINKPIHFPRVSAVNVATIAGPRSFLARFAVADNIDIPETPFDEDNP